MGNHQIREVLRPGYCIQLIVTHTRLRRRLGRLRAGDEDKDASLGREYDNHLETGFQLATFQGPLCAEPMEGLAFFVESLDIDREGIEKEQGGLPR